MQTFDLTPARLVGTCLALAGAAFLPSTASAADDSESVPSAAPTANASQIVVRDSATGQLRAPTAEEAKALQPSSRTGLRSAKAQPLTRYHTSGAQGARLTDEFMSYSVVVRQPDGRLVEQCLEGKEAADAALKSSTAVKSSAPSRAGLPTE